MMRYILGIDQGASKTHAIICDELGVILGMGTSYGACHSTSGMEYAMEAVKLAVDSALEEADLLLEDITVAAAGMSGMDWEYEEKLLADALGNILGISRIKVVNDCLIAMRAEISDYCGCILCAGSGLNCAVRNGENKEYVWGYYIDDEFQGGAALGKAMIRAVIDGQSGLGEETMMTQLLLDYLKISSVEELLYQKVNGNISNENLLYLPILLERAAMANDKVAVRIFSDFGEAIAKYIVTAIAKMDMLDTPVKVILSGSIFKCKVPVLKEAVSLEIHKHAIHAMILDAVYEPVVGAVLLGMDMILDHIAEAVTHNIGNTADKYHLKRNQILGEEE